MRKKSEEHLKNQDTDKNVILSFANHDFRDLRVDVKEAHRLLTKVSNDYDDVEFIYCEVVEAMRKAMHLEKKRKM
jgi:RNA recognition motif-containing protein